MFGPIENVVKQGRCLLLICVKASRRKGRWLTTNLATMINVTKV